MNEIPVLIQLGFSKKIMNYMKFIDGLLIKILPNVKDFYIKELEEIIIIFLLKKNAKNIVNLLLIFLNIFYVVTFTANEQLAACRLPKDEGKCTGNLKSGVEKWFFSVSTSIDGSVEAGKCAKFIYSGCGGNGNVFDSKDDCLNACQSFIYFFSFIFIR